MDEKHRQYCIKLGNPYMREERYQEQIKSYEQTSSWNGTETIAKETDWFKHKKNQF